MNFIPLWCTATIENFLYTYEDVNMYPLTGEILLHLLTQLCQAESSQHLVECPPGWGQTTLPRAPQPNHPVQTIHSPGHQIGGDRLRLLEVMVGDLGCRCQLRVGLGE